MISVDDLEKSIHNALGTHQDVKIPDEPIVIDKDLLQEIRDTLDNEAGDGNKYCAYLRDKLDNLYPFLVKDTSENKCPICNGNGFLIDPTPSPFMGIPDTTICWKCKGTGKNQ